MSIVNSTKYMVQRILRTFGWEIRRFIESEVIQLSKQLNQRGINIVLDIGANEGQFASALFLAGYKGKIISFDPLSDVHKKLKNNAASNPNWVVAEATAIGSEDGFTEINVSKNLVSSSILDIRKEHTEAAPQSRYYKKERVPLMTLDTYAKRAELKNIFLKIDTQGFEMQVLKGAESLLQSTNGLLLEMSIAPLYEGQADFMDIIQFAKVRGFELWSIEPGFANQKTGRLLQFDATFFRAVI